MKRSWGILACAIVLVACSTQEAAGADTKGAATKGADTKGADTKGAATRGGATRDAAATGLPRGEQPLDCPSDGAAIQILGSGGPIAQSSLPGRAATSYLLWIDGSPRLLIDAGSGSFLRFAEAGGKIETLDAILLSHLHADHAGDVIDILNSGGFEGRTKPLRVAGPGPAPRFPSTTQFLERLMAKETGAFAYNGGFLDGTENKPQIVSQDIIFDDAAVTPRDIAVSPDYSVKAIPVHHGPVPALGFEIAINGKTIIIAGDQSFLSEEFTAAFAGSKPVILFAHHAINGEEGQPRGLHRTPSEIGELAAQIDPARMILMHNMERSLSRIDDNLAAIAQSYDGPVSVASDLDCYAVTSLPDEG